MSSPQSAPAPRVTNDEIWQVFRYLASHPTAPVTPVAANFTPADAIFAFGRVDPAVGQTVAMLYRHGLAHWVMFTGGIGKDSGPYLTTYDFPEAAFQAAVANHAGVPQSAIITEVHARHGGDNCRLGYQAVADELNRPPASLIMVIHATSLRRLVEVFLTIAEQQGWPPVAIQACSTPYRLYPDSRIDRAEIFAEMQRLVEWPNEAGANGLPKLRTQPELSADLADIYARLKAEQTAV